MHEFSTYLTNSSPNNHEKLLTGYFSAMLNVEAPVLYAFDFNLRTPAGSLTESFDRSFVSTCHTIHSQPNHDPILTKTHSTPERRLLYILEGTGHHSKHYLLEKEI